MPMEEAKNLPGMRHFLQMKSMDTAMRLFKDNPISPEMASEMKSVIESCLIQGFVLGRKYEEKTRGSPRAPSRSLPYSEGQIDRLEEIMTGELPPAHPE